MVTRRTGRLVAAVLVIGVIAALATCLGAGQAAAWPWDNLGDKAEDAAKGILSRIVNAILYALISLMKYVMTFFTAEKTNLDANAFTSMIEWATDYTYQLQSAFLFLSIVLVGGRLAVAQWTGGQGAVTSGISVSVRALATSLGAATVVILLARASDIFAAWIYDDTGDRVTQVTDEVKKKIGTIDAENFDGSSLLLVIIALIAVLGCLDLLIQLFLRLFYLAFGTAMLPVAAAASGTEGGQSTYNQVMRLLAAMLAFKPICAGAFALAMSYPLSDTSDASDVFIAVLLYVSPILCMPTLLALVGVGGSVHGRVSGLAGAAALIGGGRVASRLGGKTMRGAAGAAGRMGGGKGGGGRPSGTSPTPPRGGGGGAGGGGRFAPAAATAARGGGKSGGGSGGGGPRSAAASASPRSSSGQSSSAGGGGDKGTPRHAATNGAGGGRDTSGSAPGAAGGRHGGGSQSAPPQPGRDSSTTPGAGSPRSSRPPTASPRSTVSSARSAGGDRRNNAKSIARRNLGTHYIGRR